MVYVTSMWLQPLSTPELPIGKRFCLLVTEQQEIAEALTVTNTLYFFEDEEASKDLGCGSALDLGEVEDVEQPAANERLIRLSTENGWAMELTAV